MPYNDIDMNNNLSRLMNQYGNEYTNGNIVGELPVGDGRTYEYIYGTQGILKLYTDPDYSVILEHADGQVEKFAVGKITTNEEQQAGIRSSTGVIDEFVAAVTENRPSCLDAEQAIHAMRVVLKAAQ